MFAIMFRAFPGGNIEPIKWSKDNLQPDTSIIVFDEGTQTMFLWHGEKQGLIARKTALRQVYALKGHEYSFKNRLIEMEIKTIKEIDHGKLGSDPETYELYNELQEILNKEYKEVGDYMITFQLEDIEGAKMDLKKSIRPREKPELIKEIEVKPEDEFESVDMLKVTPKAKTSSKSVQVEEKTEFNLETLKVMLKSIDNKIDSLIKEFSEFKKISKP